MRHIGKSVSVRLAILLGAAWFAISVIAIVRLANPPAPPSAYTSCIEYVNQHRMTTAVCGPLSPAATGPADAGTGEFNAGFADSKRDDCEQGDAKACAWLRSN